MRREKDSVRSGENIPGHACSAATCSAIARAWNHRYRRRRASFSIGQRSRIRAPISRTVRAADSGAASRQRQQKKELADRKLDRIYQDRVERSTNLKET